MVSRDTDFLKKRIRSQIDLAVNILYSYYFTISPVHAAVTRNALYDHVFSRTEWKQGMTRICQKDE
jgi:hypothetical protein